MYGTYAVKFAANATNFSVELWKDDVLTFSKTASDLEECRKWLPMEWKKSYSLLGTGDSYGYFGEDPNYGWWPAN